MKNFNFILIALAILTFTVSCKKDVPPVTPPSYDLTKLNAIKASTAPTVDGVVDGIWANAPILTVAIGETGNPPNDPSKINNCAGCHAYNSAITVKLRAVYTATDIYILSEWSDPTASFTRNGSWSFASGSWAKPNTVQSEDRISFYWPMGATTGDPYNTKGCMAKCHMYWPQESDPHPHANGDAIVDDAWLSAGRADLWHSKAARAGAVTSATGSGLTVDPASHEVTAGTFSMVGYVDDTYVGPWSGTNGEDGGRYGDAGTAAASHNRIADKSRPKWMEKNPTDFADAMFITKAEIDGGECVGDATTGVSDADAALYWPKYAALNAIVCERIHVVPTGSRADLTFGATWSNGTWKAEIGRKLNTGHDDDINYTDFLKEYLFNVAQFDNSRHGYEHRVSPNYYMKFIQ
ncbi:MAG: hypothetical protein AUJ98_02335 [Bacteroidetes bacterium CG2_30_33_31]|nr:MAG: hypothetical protein AUJ98_02335 [Bacteroidetes bacterium CG2_30_33_31]